MSEMKFCFQCEHGLRVDRELGTHGSWVCQHKEARDLVTGNPRLCVDMRRGLLACGEMAIWYKQTGEK